MRTSTSEQGWSRPWNRISDGYAALARYCSTKALDRVGLAQNYQTDLLLKDGPAPVARDLFAQLVRRDFGYNLDQWNADAGQLIREPIDILRGSGTCLDFAALYCAMAKDAGLRPYLAIAHGEQDHAFVLIDTSARAADVRTSARASHVQSAPIWASLNDDGCVAVREQALVGDIDQDLVGDIDRADLPDSLPPNWLPVDPTDACRSTAAHPRSHNFDDTVTVATGHLLSGSLNRIVLIDVVGAHAAGFPELEPDPRSERERPVIFRRVPAIVGYQEIQSRQEVIDDLSTRSGYVVLCGQPGVGKSLTATLVANAAAGGAGWFLNAEDAATLKVELAEAAMGHLGIDPTGLEFNDIRAYSGTAFEILQSSAARWVVVLDNANRIPKDYGRLPVPREEQLVIITTTNQAAWSAWADRQSTPTLVREMLPLTERERRSWPGAEQIADPPGTPLLLNLAVRLASRGALPEGRDVTALVAAGLQAISDRATLAARSLTLIPPVIVEAGDLPIDPEAAASAAAELADVGLVQRVDDSSAAMHRSIRAAARDLVADATLDSQVLAQLLLNPPSARHFEAAATVTELSALADLLTRSGLPSDTVGECLWALGSFQERKDSTASAAWFEQALKHLPPPDDVVDPRQAVIVAACVQGVARSALRRPAAAIEEKVAARESLTPVFRLGDRFPEDIPVQLAVSRADAMDALLRRQLAKAIEDAERRRSELRESLDQLERSAERRAELVHEVTADIDRSRFNIPGTLIDLAKEGEPHKAAETLDRAAAIYREVHDVRVRRYRTEESEEVITCVHGQAIVNYYRAVLIPNLTVSERQALLITAVDQASQAMRVRQRLASPALMSEDSLKSTSLATKALLLLHDIGEASRVAKAGAFGALVDEATAEHELLTHHLIEESQ